MNFFESTIAAPRSLKHLSNKRLIADVKELARKERELTLEVLHYLKEIDLRMAYAEEGYGSLFEFVTKELGYPDGSAQRRIDAMRLINDVPEAEEKFMSGALNLTLMSQAQSFFKYKKASKNEKTKEEKAEILKNLEGKSTREADYAFASMAPERPRPDSQKPISETQTELKFTADQELMDLIARTKELGHGSLNDIFKSALKEYLKKKDPIQAPAPAPEEIKENKIPGSRYVSRSLKRAVHQRAGGQCEFVAASGRRCERRANPEMDHKHAFARGGQTTYENLRVLCSTHNHYEAFKTFGAGKVPRRDWKYQTGTPAPEERADSHAGASH